MLVKPLVGHAVSHSLQCASSELAFSAEERSTLGSMAIHDTVRCACCRQHMWSGPRFVLNTCRDRFNRNRVPSRFVQQLYVGHFRMPTNPNVVVQHPRDRETCSTKLRPTINQRIQRSFIDICFPISRLPSLPIKGYHGAPSDVRPTPIKSFRHHLLTAMKSQREYMSTTRYKSQFCFNPEVQSAVKKLCVTHVLLTWSSSNTCSGKPRRS